MPQPGAQVEAGAKVPSFQELLERNNLTPGGRVEVVGKQLGDYALELKGTFRDIKADEVAGIDHKGTFLYVLNTTLTDEQVMATDGYVALKEVATINNASCTIGDNTDVHRGQRITKRCIIIHYTSPGVPTV